MKKQTIFTGIIALLMMMAMPAGMEAQGFLKKLNKGLEKVNKAMDNASTKVDVATGQAVVQENGITVMNPLSKAVDVELIGAYGVSTSENFGEVELVMKVTLKIPENRIGFGGNSASKPTQAFDTDGNSYVVDHPSLNQNFDVAEGVPVKITLSGDKAFKKVHKSATALALVKLNCIINWDYVNHITFKNVPIQWDVEH